ncbi:MAG: hypothetical protein R3C44_21355 [Chloroflexota bacterium]
MAQFSRSRWTAVVIACLGLLYVLVFIPPNLTGAQDPNMLAAFQIDEFAQFPYVVQMTNGGDLATAVHNFFYYNHYFYGFPFYLTSALAVLPLRLAAVDPLLDTTSYMVILRQLSPLLMVLAIGLLTYTFTGFRRLWPSIFLFGFLLLIPAVFANNLWWHPESLTMLFVVIVIFALNKDHLRFGRWFYVAAVAAGLAAGTKLAGFWFVLTVAVYLILGSQQNGWKSMLRHGAGFLAVMVLSILIANPLLLDHSVRTAIIATQLDQAARNAFGWYTAAEKGLAPWYAAALKPGFGQWWILLLALGACVTGVVLPNRQRLLYTIILTWVLPYSLYLVLFVGNQQTRYLLPIVVPLLACWATNSSTGLTTNGRCEQRSPSWFWQLLPSKPGCICVMISACTGPSCTGRRKARRWLSFRPLMSRCCPPLNPMNH